MNNMFLEWTPGNVLTVLSIPFHNLKSLFSAPQCSRPGVYMLVGRSGARPVIYIGQGKDPKIRLLSHYNKEREKWKRAILLSSPAEAQEIMEQNAKYLERVLIRNAKFNEIEWRLENDKVDDYDYVLNDKDHALMANYIEELREALPVLGLDFLPDGWPLSFRKNGKAPRFELISNYGPIATGIPCFSERGDHFVVSKGSLAIPGRVRNYEPYERIYHDLLRTKVLRACDEGYRFARDYPFSSITAAAVVCGVNSGAMSAWRVIGKKQSYGEWRAR